MSGRSAPATGAVIPAASQSIVTGGAAQSVFPAKQRNFMLFQNTSAGDLWVGFGVTPTVGGPGLMKLVAGAIYEFQGCYVPSGPVSIIGATTGQNFLALQG